MSYDTSALEFVSGDGVQADGSGNLTYSGSGTGSENISCPCAALTIVPNIGTVRQTDKIIAAAFFIIFM